ncbi:hypothetical protein TRICI_002347 [Trichomonascus ciferrii]|uniref:Uncharacterized protein n=1 Tax=Trichomonascus ciferrii TaxID=44093 RepID=A0A642V631_9ASCO|nr:hypothetical protein TRICI_002347 [Trichomonascus ciferrii]
MASLSTIHRRRCSNLNNHNLTTVPILGSSSSSLCLKSNQSMERNTNIICHHLLTTTTMIGSLMLACAAAAATWAHAASPAGAPVSPSDAHQDTLTLSETSLFQTNTPEAHCAMHQPQSTAYWACSASASVSASGPQSAVSESVRNTVSKATAAQTALNTSAATAAPSYRKTEQPNRGKPGSDNSINLKPNTCWPNILIHHLTTLNCF